MVETGMDPVTRARALLAAASKGPLYAVEGGTSCNESGLYGTLRDGMSEFPADIHDRRKGMDSSVWTVSRFPEVDGWTTDGGHHGYGPSEADAELWAAAPTLIAELVDEVERLRSALADTEATVKHAGKTIMRLRAERPKL